MPPDGGTCTIDVRDLRVLVTAGAGGIGRTLAERFSAAGARVHITDVAADAVEETVASVAGVSGTAGDASAPEHVDRVVADIRARFGGLDVLVNNVGIAGPTKRVDALADADIERTIAVNLNSHFYFLSRCVPLLRASKGNASIVAMSSVAGRLGYAFRTPYAASKWAIVGLVKSLAAELGPEGIRANAILPGVVQGPRMDAVIEERAKAEGVSIAEMRESYLNRISLRRMVEADDIASLTMFLASNLARNITGQAISIDGNVEHL